MVSGLRIEGGTQVESAQVRKSIQSIKEIFVDHSEADIYTTLKETNMDPNDTALKLLTQDPFHEVKRKTDKKKENVGHKDLVDPRKYSEDMELGKRFQTFSDRNFRRPNYPVNALPRIKGEFRIVRDNRVNQNIKDIEPTSLKLSASDNEQSINLPKKSPTGTLGGEKSSGGRGSSQRCRRSSVSLSRNLLDGYIGVTGSKESSEDKQAAVLNSTSLVQAVKANGSQLYSEIQEPSAVGVYSSATDPVHVPSPDSRSSVPVGAIKREVGVVGVRRQSSDGSGNHSSLLGSSLSNSLVGKNGSPVESFRPFISVSKVDQPSQTTESVTPSIVGSRAFFSNQHSSRHQQHVGHQKASQPNKEWKPKASQKSSINNRGVVGTLTSSVPSAAESKDLTSKEVSLQDKLSRVNINDNQNVIIAKHIRVPEADRCQLTFGSFGTDLDSSRILVSESPAIRAPDESVGKPVASLPESSMDDASGGQQVDFQDDQITEADSPVSIVDPELQLPDKRASLNTQDLSTYADIGIGRESSPAHATSSHHHIITTYATESHHQNSSDFEGFPAYDTQTGYDIPYFRPIVDDAVRIQGLPSSYDSLSSHPANIPASTFSMVQQQQQPIAQMYPQVHLSHYANLMPYRQFLSPVYVPPMAMPGYSSNPAYPHPSNGSSYLLMPGGNSHLNTSNLKYGMQQFKPVPAGNPTGFGNFSNPSGYAMNAPSVIGSANGLEDSSRIKYKDGNLYIPNPQAETSEIWIQNPREVPNLQSSPYYSMPGQAPHAAYLPSHTGHASFNAVPSQSSHMQFPGLYHPPQQPPAIASPHHMGPGMAGNAGAGLAAAAPGPQVGAYQPPQLGHLNWTTNF